MGCLYFLKGVIVLGLDSEMSTEPRVIFNDDLGLSDLVDFAVVKVKLFQEGIDKFFLFMEVSFG